MNHGHENGGMEGLVEKDRRLLTGMCDCCVVCTSPGLT